jgi:anti-sigma regulatory factor (Ser/Thr protein kinase)
LDLTFAPDPIAPALARAAVGGTLPETVPLDKRADIMLLVSEVVTNAVRYGGSEAADEIVVGVEARAGRLRVEVVNRGRTFEAAEQREPERASGWGLYLLNRLTSDWGIEARASSIVVWFEVSV